MAFDSTIRLKQLNNPEISGYILGVVGNYLPGQTGYYSGVFYPYSTNPSGYIGTGVTGQFANAAAVTNAINTASTQTLTYVALNYLPIGTPLGTGGTGSFAPLFEPITKVSGNFNIYSSGSIYLVDTTQQVVTGTFPNASGLAGYTYVIKDWKGNSLNNNIILTGTNNQGFDSDSISSFNININYGSFNFLSDGKRWCLVYYISIIIYVQFY